MAALTRPTEATYEVHENVTVDTYDNEDHTFCGIMFPVGCKADLPLDHILINSVAVRGRLGPVSVYVSEETIRVRDTDRHNSQDIMSRFRFTMHDDCWNKIYTKTLPPSYSKYKPLTLDIPIKLRPGEIKAVYVHSTLHSDRAIVYDNTPYTLIPGMIPPRYEDEKISVYSGRAHVSPVPFSNESIWGWGGAWRDRREFVGRLDYGVIYQLWQPTIQPKFPTTFQDGARILFLCQRRWESNFSKLPDECIFYILNMCKYDWFHYDPSKVSYFKKKRAVNSITTSMKKNTTRRKKRDKTTPTPAIAACAAAAAATAKASAEDPDATTSTAASLSEEFAVCNIERAPSSSRWKGALRKLNVFGKKNN